MTPEERALRDAYLAELWPTVREYHDGDPLPKRSTKRRASKVDKPVDRARKKAS